MHTSAKTAVSSSTLDSMQDTSRATETDVLSQQGRDRLRARGVIFTDLASALHDHPELVEKFARRTVRESGPRWEKTWNTLFVYVPRGVKLDMPLHADFLITGAQPDAHDRTLIVCDEGSRVAFIEGCTAPVYLNSPLRLSIAEVIVNKGAHCRYTTLQNWSRNVRFNGFTYASVGADATMEWIDLHLGSKRTKRYSSARLLEPGAKCEIASFGFAGRDQHQCIGGSIEHCAPHTISRIASKSIGKDGGLATHRGWIKVSDGCHHVQSGFETDTLLLDADSKAETNPCIETRKQDSSVSYTSRVSRMDREQLFYLRSRGLSEEQARWTVVDGFTNSFAAKLPMEYAVEMKSLIELELEDLVA